MEKVWLALGNSGIKPLTGKHPQSCHELAACHTLRPPLPGLRGAAAPAVGSMDGPWSSREKARSIITRQEMVSETSLVTGYLKLYDSKAASKSSCIKVHRLP